MFFFNYLFVCLFYCCLCFVFYKFILLMQLKIVQAGNVPSWMEKTLVDGNSPSYWMMIYANSREYLFALFVEESLGKTWLFPIKVGISRNCTIPSQRHSQALVSFSLLVTGRAQTYTWINIDMAFQTTQKYGPVLLPPWEISFSC